MKRRKRVSRRTITLINSGCFFLQAKKGDETCYKNCIHPPVAYVYCRSVDNNKARIEAERNPFSKAREEIQKSGKVGRANWMGVSKNCVCGEKCIANRMTFAS